MTDRELAILFYREAVEDTATHYRSFFGAAVEEATDPLWRDLLSWAASLPSEKRELLVRFGRQAAADGVSTVLGVLDGSSFLPGQTGDFSLRYEAQSEPLNGMLQDYFLEAVEADDHA